MRNIACRKSIPRVKRSYFVNHPGTRAAAGNDARIAAAMAINLTMLVIVQMQK